MNKFNEHNPQIVTTCPPGEYLLHGDVIVFGENALPMDFESMPRVKDNCVAYGEVTGHRHQLFGNETDFDLRECSKTKVRHLKVVSPIMLKHQEHSPIQVPPGNYRIGIQREYSPFEKRSRQVVD